MTVGCAACCANRASRPYRTVFCSSFRDWAAEEMEHPPQIIVQKKSCDEELLQQRFLFFTAANSTKGSTESPGSCHNRISKRSKAVYRLLAMHRTCSRASDTLGYVGDESFGLGDLLEGH